MQRKWNRESVIAAIQRWADEHGGIPPSATDWNPALARHLGHAEKAEKFYADGCWPHLTTVRTHLGGWNAACVAAGFEPRRSGHYGRDGEDPAIVAETVRLYRSGLTLAEVGVRQGVGIKGVLGRLDKAGEPRRARFTSAPLPTSR